MIQLFRILWAVAKRVGPSKIGVIAAGIAFYALLAVFPAITAVIALAGLFIAPEAVVAQFETITRFVPEEAATILIDEASKVAGAGDDGLTLAVALGIGFAVYLSTRATTALIFGLNAVHDRDENRGFFRFWGVVILLTTALVFGVALMFVLLVVAPTVLAFLPEEVIPGTTAEAVRAVRWIILGALLLFGLSVLYRFGPTGRSDGAVRAPRKWRWVTAGSALAAALWIAGSFGFSLYVTHFANYNASFGSLAGVIILLTWLWLSAFVILLGALLDVEVRRSLSDSVVPAEDEP
ncbi:MAG: YihY/virulence factor BrkB family protein [Pseudomonadota bacterium]